MKLTRRSVLRGMAAAPLAGAAVAQKLAASGLQVGTQGLSGRPVAAQAQNELSTKAYHSFDGWLRDIGAQQIKDESRYVNCVDPDIASLHVPVATMVRMQQARNYKCQLRAREKWFSNTLRRVGFVTWCVD